MTRKIKQVIVAALAAVMLLSMTPLMPGAETVHAGTQTPAKVTGVKASVSKTKVTVKWQKAKRATKYKVLIQVKSGKKWKAFKTMTAKKTTARFNGKTGSTYRVRVCGVAGKMGKWSAWKAVKVGGQNSTPNKNTVKPSPVKNIKVKENKRGLTISWDKPNVGSRYRITGYAVAVRRVNTAKEVSWGRGKYTNLGSKTLKPDKTSVNMCGHVQMLVKKHDKKCTYQVQISYEYERTSDSICSNVTSDWKDFTIDKGWPLHDMKVVKHKDATWDKKGYDLFRCTECGYEEKEDVFYVVTEKDEERILKNIMAMESKYPDHMKWGYEEGACGGFAAMMRKAVFPPGCGGDIQGKWHKDFDNIHAGDCIACDDGSGGHIYMVIGVEEDGYINSVEGNLNGQVRWHYTEDNRMTGRYLKYSRKDNSQEWNTQIFTYYQPYPEGATDVYQEYKG